MAFGSLAGRYVLGSLVLSSRPRMSSSVSGVAAVVERQLLRGVLTEALQTQERKRNALQLQQQETPLESEHDEEEVRAKARAKAIRRAEMLPTRLAEVAQNEAVLVEMLGRLRTRGVDLTALRRDVEGLGLAKRLQSFDVHTMTLNQWGRPDGFDGLVVESPRGIPVLVSRQSFKDALLRRIGRGSDLWFQVREGRGSRVLLRTSMVPSLARAPRECMEFAADCAAFFSDWRRSPDDVEIIFTDSKRVAKRGTRVGQMKDSKRLGMLRGRPQRVAETARDAQEEQGWM